VAGLPDDLRCHELRSAGDALEGRAAPPGDTVQELAGVEVSELDDAVFGHEDVAAFDVAVYYPVRVQEGETAEYLVRVNADDALVKSAELLEHVRDTAPTHILEEDKETLGIVRLFSAEVTNNVFVIGQRAEQVDFPPEGLSSCRRFVAKRYLLHGKKFSGAKIDALIDLRKGTFPALLPPQILRKRTAI